MNCIGRGVSIEKHTHITLVNGRWENLLKCIRYGTTIDISDTIYNLEVLNK